MRSVFLLLMMLGVFRVMGAAPLILSPSDSCGVFTTLDGIWSRMPPSDVTVSYNQDGLEIRGVLRKPQGETFLAKGVKDDDFAIFSGDVFEVLIHPPNRENNYYHFALGASGYVYTAKKRDKGWKASTLFRQSRCSGNEWNIVLFISYTDLETSAPKENDQWRMLLARTNVDAQGTRECSSYSGATNFHDLSQYTVVTFSKPGAAKPPLIRQCINDNAQVKIVFERLPMPEEMIAECVVENTHVSKPLVVERHRCSVTVPFDGYIPAKGYRHFAIELKNKVSGKILFSQKARLPLTLQGDALVPDSFYYVAGEGTMGVKQYLGKKATLSLKSDAGCVVQIKKARMEEKIPLKGLAPGRYVLEVQAERLRTSRVVFILPDKPKLREIPSDASLKIVDGRYMELAGIPTYLWGISNSKHYFFQFEPATNLLYGAKGRQPNGVLSLGFPSVSKLHRKPVTSFEYIDLEQHVEATRKFVSGIPPRRPVLPRIRYEASLPRLVIHPDGTKTLEDTAARFARIYEEARKANPNLLYTIHIDNPLRMNDFASSCDVFEYAAFSSSYSKNMMPHLVKDLEYLKSRVLNKPLIFWLGGTVPDAYSRSAEELRCAVYCCILKGISGNIVHLGHGYLPEERRRVWSLISGILAEVQTFYGDFVTGTDMTAELRCSDGKEVLRKVVRTRDGGMLLVVNTSPVERHFHGILNGKVYAKTLTPFEPYVFRIRRDALRRNQPSIERAE